MQAESAVQFILINLKWNECQVAKLYGESVYRMSKINQANMQASKQIAVLNQFFRF